MSTAQRTFRQEGEQAYSIPQACLGDKHCGACLESANLDLELGLLPRTLSAFTLPLEDLCQRCQYLPSEGICGRWRLSDCTLLPWSSEYKVMRCCSNMHLEPPPSWGAPEPGIFLSLAFFSEMGHIQMAGSKEPSPAPNEPCFMLKELGARTSLSVAVGLPRAGLLGFVWGHEEGTGENLAFCNSREKSCLPQTWKKN